MFLRLFIEASWERKNYGFVYLSASDYGEWCGLNTTWKSVKAALTLCMVIFCVILSTSYSHLGHVYTIGNSWLLLAMASNTSSIHFIFRFFFFFVIFNFYANVNKRRFFFSTETGWSVNNSQFSQFKYFVSVFLDFLL